MALTPFQAKFGKIRTGIVLLVKIYRRDRNLASLVLRSWRIGSRKGLPGLRQWIVDTALVDPTANKLPTDAAPQPPLDAKEHYRKWLDNYDILSVEHTEAAQRHIAQLNLPELLILAVIDRHDLPYVDRIVASWQASLHVKWQAAIIASSELEASERDFLCSAVSNDNRICIVIHTEEIEELREKFRNILLIFGGSVLNSLSTYMFLEAAARSKAAIIYSDHDQILADGQRSNPKFKPQYSPQYLAQYNYIADCLFVSPSSSWNKNDSAELFHITPDGIDHWVRRLLLATSAMGQPIEHLPFVLFHVLRERSRRLSDLTIPMLATKNVSIIISTDIVFSEFKASIESILEKTFYDHERIELVIIDRGPVEPERDVYLDSLAKIMKVAVIHSLKTKTISEAKNIGAAAAHGEILVFLKVGTIVCDERWLNKLVTYSQLADVGIVGSKPLYEDKTVRYRGSVAGGGLGTVQHLVSLADADAIAFPDHTREMSLLPDACFAITRIIFQKIGGFDPILHTTWSNIAICLAALSLGLRNLYIADLLLTCVASDVSTLTCSREEMLEDFSEADYTRRKYRDYFYDDPFYNPNLSLDIAGELAEPPRVRLPWHDVADFAPRVLLLSIVYKIGYGVPVVIQQHARKLLERGYQVVIGGPITDNEHSFPGCERVALNSAKEAASYAFLNKIALVVIHTPPFFDLPALIGGYIPTLGHDHGEPPAHLFKGTTQEYLVRVSDRKRRSGILMTAINVISEAVREETLYPEARVVKNANSHLLAWSETLRTSRDRIRAEQGWQNKFIILTVCRFQEGERSYKGLDKIAEILREFPYLYPDLATHLQWVVAGAGTEEDVKEVEALGFKVYPNVSNSMLADLYQAADVYLSFSKWEGYNLGIGQAIAMGLPVLASDLSVHREFGVKTTDSILVSCEWLANEIEHRTASSPAFRSAKVTDWNVSANEFVDVVDNLLRHPLSRMPRFGVF